MRLRALFIVAAAGSALLSAQAVHASTAAPAVKATAFTISPSPDIAPEGSLAPGQQVSLTLTAWNGSAVDPHARVWIAFVSFFPDGHLAYGGAGAYGTLAVSSTALKYSGGGDAYLYQANASGQLTLTYASAATQQPPKAGWSDAIIANTIPAKPHSVIGTMAYSEYVYGS
jgi:hypothetical protein